MLKNSRFGNYLLYAVGEIVLVMVGILIALQINKTQEAKKTAMKVTALMADIQKDLLSDLTQSKTVIPAYEMRDSLISHVLSGDVQEADFRKSPGLLSLITWYAPYTVNTSGYENLMRYSDFIPAKFDSVMPILDRIYVSDAKSIEFLNTELSDLVTSTIQGWSDSYEWYFDISQKRYNQDAADYFLENPFYKNKVVLYRSYAIDNLLRAARTHELMAVLAYKGIAEAIGQTEMPAEIAAYMIDLQPEDVKKLEGTYALLPTFKVKLFKAGRQMFIQATNQPAVEIYAKNDTVLFNPLFDIEVNINVNKTGEVESLNLSQGGQNLYFKKEVGE